MRCPSCDTPNTPEARFCSHCGGKLPQAQGCPEIEIVEEVEPRRRRRADDDYERRPRHVPDDEDESEEEPGAVATIIPYRNGKALASYYLGMLGWGVVGALAVMTVFALMTQERSWLAFYGLIAPLGILVGPLALLLGILGLRSAIHNPTAKGKGHAIFGIISGMLATILSLAALFAFLSNLERNTRVLKELWKMQKEERRKL